MAANNKKKKRNRSSSSFRQAGQKRQFFSGIKGSRLDVDGGADYVWLFLSLSPLRFLAL